MKRVKFLLLMCLAFIVTFTATAQASSLGNKYKLEKVLVLSRHNIRAPLVEKNSVLAEVTPYKWYEWKEPAGNLSLRGGLEETAMGQYFRRYLVNEGFITEDYVPTKGEMRFYANSFQRTIATAQYFISGMLPVAGVEVEHKFDINKADPTFISSTHNVNAELLRRADIELKHSGYREELAKSLADYADAVAKVIDFKNSPYAKKNGVTKFSVDDFKITADNPFVNGSIRLAMSAGDALVMQYYEEDDAVKAAFGKNLTQADWEKIAATEYFGLNLFLEWRSWSTVFANPLLKVMRDELADGSRRFTFLCGHDTNIVMVLSALGVENYTLNDTIEKKVPIGCKIVIEKRRGTDGREYAAINLVYQNTAQLRTLEKLTPENPPQIFQIKLKDLQANEDGLYLYSDFERRLNDVIAEYNLLVN